MRKLEYYGFDNDTTMYKTENPPMDTISIVKEIKNEKYIDDEDETCEESTIYEIVGTPSYPSEIEGTATSFDITVNYTKTDTDSACTETVTEGSDTVTVDCGSNPSTTDSRTVSGTVIWNDIEIEYSLTQKKYFDPYNGYEYVDLGLPSGTKWATKNVGAESITNYGNYYAYGKGISQYNNSDSAYGGRENPLARNVDTAAQVMGGSWHMPTKAQFDELIANTTYSLGSIDGTGYVLPKFTAANGNCVYFPLAGYWRYGTLDGKYSYGWYWSSTPHTPGTANMVRLTDDNASVMDGNCKYGCSVRGVVG